MINIRCCSCAAEEFFSHGGGLQSVKAHLVKLSTKGNIFEHFTGAQLSRSMKTVIPGLAVTPGSTFSCDHATSN